MGKEEKGEIMRNEKITLLYEVLSPLTHMMGVAGNESLINREPVMTSFGKRFVPVLSGNSIRHNLIRESGVNYIFDLLNIEELSNMDQLNFLYTGGTLCESATVGSVEKVKKMYETLPLFKLLGGSLRNQIIAGMMMVGRGVMICQENLCRLESIFSKEYLRNLPERLFSAEMFVGNYQYTRGDVTRQKQNKIETIPKDTLFEEDEKEKKSNLMIYNGQSVISGAMFVNDFILQDVNDIDIGAFFASISHWQETDSTLGGSGRIGHGKIKIHLLNDLPVSQYVEKYKSHMLKQDVRDFLNYLFPEK